MLVKGSRNAGKGSPQTLVKGHHNAGKGLSEC